MIITPLESPHDKSAGFSNHDTNRATEENCGKMGSDWKFDENIALMVASQRREGEDVMGAKLQGGYGDYICMMVESTVNMGAV